MAEVESCLLAFLMQDTDVLAAFGNRISPDKMPDGSGETTTDSFARLTSLPAAITYTQDGEGPRTELIQIDIWNKDKATLMTHAGYIKAALSGFRGAMGSAAAGFVHIGSAFVNNVRGNWDEDIRKFRRILEVRLATNG